MTERLRSASTVACPYSRMETDLSPKKSLLVLVIVVGCFAVLWPKVFYPMLVGSATEHMKPSAIDRTTGCCDVISELDVNTVKIMSELCGTISKQAGDEYRSPKEIYDRCRSEILQTCGIDVAYLLQDKVNLGKNVKLILEEIRSSNGSLCLKYNFGVSPWSLGVPHRVASKAGPISSVRQERPLRSEIVHPAFRERGSAIPHLSATSKPSRSPPRIVEGKPGPVPGMRPTIGGPGRVVPPPKQGANGMSIIMPIYTIGIVIFFTYTLLKVIFKKQPEGPGGSLYPPIESDPHFRREVFETENSRLASRAGRDNASKLVVNAMSALLDEVDQELEMRRKANEVAAQELSNGLSNGSVPSKEPEPTVKVMGMEMRASCEDGAKWPARSTSPILPPSPSPPPAEPLPPPQEIYLEGALSPQSHVLVADSATEAQPIADAEDPAVVLAGKMTLSVINFDNSENEEEIEKPINVESVEKVEETVEIGEENEVEIEKPLEQIEPEEEIEETVEFTGEIQESTKQIEAEEKIEEEIEKPIENVETEEKVEETVEISRENEVEIEQPLEQIEQEAEIEETVKFSEKIEEPIEQIEPEEKIEESSQFSEENEDKNEQVEPEEEVKETVQFSEENSDEITEIPKEELKSEIENLIKEAQKIANVETQVVNQIQDELKEKMDSLYDLETVPTLPIKNEEIFNKILEETQLKSELKLQKEDSLNQLTSEKENVPTETLESTKTDETEEQIAINVESVVEEPKIAIENSNSINENTIEAKTEVLTSEVETEENKSSPIVESEDGKTETISNEEIIEPKEPQNEIIDSVVDNSETQIEDTKIENQTEEIQDSKPQNEEVEVLTASPSEVLSTELKEVDEIEPKEIQNKETIEDSELHPHAEPKALEEPEEVEEQEEEEIEEEIEEEVEVSEEEENEIEIDEEKQEVRKEIEEQVNEVIREPSPQLDDEYEYEEVEVEVETDEDDDAVVQEIEEIIYEDSGEESDDGDAVDRRIRRDPITNSSNATAAENDISDEELTDNDEVEDEVVHEVNNVSERIDRNRID